MSEFASLTTILAIIATAVMAASAAIQGHRQEFDPFGATVLAIVASVGGGTLRDLLIGATPVFWLTDMSYLATAVPIGLLTYYLARKLKKGGGRRMRLLLYFDAMGLALFTLTGAQAALASDLSITSAIVLGCITGVAGGMFRDVLCGIQPSILKQDLYATISIIGGAIYTIGRDYMPETAILAVAFIFMITLRSIVIYRSASSKNQAPDRQ